MNYELKPFHQAGYDFAYATFHNPHAVAFIPPVATIEYMAALTASMQEHVDLHNVSITVMEHMPADVAAFVHDGDFRQFVPGQAFLDDVAAHVLELIGVTHFFDAGWP